MKRTGRYKTHRVTWLVAGALLLIVACLLVGFVMTRNAGAPKTGEQKTTTPDSKTTSQKTNARVARVNSSGALDREVARLKASPIYSDRSLQQVPSVDWTNQDIIVVDVSIPTYMALGAATIEGNDTIVINLTMPPIGCMHTQDNRQIVFFVTAPKGNTAYSVSQRVHENTAVCEWEK